MPELAFQVEQARAVAHSATPALALQLRVTNRSPADPVRAAMLQCQVKLEAPARAYSPAEREGLNDLFGAPERWGTTLRSLLWAQVSVMVPPFSEAAQVEVALPCSYDFNAAASKYFFALEGGEVPLTLLFNGTVFYETASGQLQVAPVPWSAEARFRLPVALWREVMEQHHPGRVYLSLERASFERLARFKSSLGLPTWERALDRLFEQLPEGERAP